MPKLEYLMTYRADLKEPVDVGTGPTGSRMIYDVTGGSFDGPKLKGRILPSGADWLLIDKDGVGQLDVRTTFETNGARVVEAHLLDFDADLYGRRVRLAFIQRLREERAFVDATALRRQIAADCNEARALFEQMSL